MIREDLLLETTWDDATEEEFAALWASKAAELRGETRTSTIYLVAGPLLPV